MSTYPVVDTTPAVCEYHVDVTTRFGCCNRCQPRYFAEMAS
jgi:hypothetical protein